MLSTKHLVLGLLVERPGYGYELQARLEDRFGFLELGDTVVYRVLDRLEHEGLIEEAGAKVVGTSRRSPRMTYVVTADGAAEFDQWLSAPCDATVVREELHAKLVLSRPMNLDGLVAETVEQERACLAELATLAQAPLETMVDADVPWPVASALLVDDARAIRLQGHIDWLQRVRIVLERHVTGAGQERG